MIAAFNQIQIIKSHKWLIAFITQFGLYKILITLFSLYNAPIIFLNYINYILYNTFNDYYTVYFNNVFVFSKTHTEYIKYINKII